MSDMTLYFKNIKTEQDYWNLRGSGMAFELFPTMPTSWEQHLIALEEYDQGQG